MRDAQGKLFETDVVVSDASTDLRSETCLTACFQFKHAFGPAGQEKLQS